METFIPVFGGDKCFFQAGNLFPIENCIDVRIIHNL